MYVVMRIISWLVLSLLVCVPCAAFAAPSASVDVASDARDVRGLVTAMEGVGSAIAEIPADSDTPEGDAPAQLPMGESSDAEGGDDVEADDLALEVPNRTAPQRLVRAHVIAPVGVMERTDQVDPSGLERPPRR